MPAKGKLALLQVTRVRVNPILELNEYDGMAVYSCVGTRTATWAGRTLGTLEVGSRRSAAPDGLHSMGF